MTAAGPPPKLRAFRLRGEPEGVKISLLPQRRGSRAISP